MRTVLLGAVVLLPLAACQRSTEAPAAATPAATPVAVVSATATPAPTEVPASVSPEADAVLHAMSDKLAAAKEISFRVRQEARGGTAGEGPAKSEREVLLVRPNQVRVRFTGGDKKRTTLYDGKVVVVEMAHDKVYVRQPAEVDIDTLLDKGADLGFEMAFADVMYASPYDSFVGPGVKATLAPSEDVGGTRCSRIDFEHASVAGSLWVAEGDKPLPRKLELRYTEPAGSVNTVEWHDWDLAAKVPANTFQYTPPKGFHEIPLARAPRAAAASAAAAATTPEASAEKKGE